MSLDAAQELLSHSLPEDTFGINKKYRIYRVATGIQDNKNSATNPRDHRWSCDSDHCFGRDLIGWTPTLGRCASNVRIGIIDTSVDLSHPTFSRQDLELSHFDNGASPAPDWHGTGITALLAGDPASETPGLIPEAKFVIADIFHADSDGQPVSDTVGMLRALDWLDAERVTIVNMSLSGSRDELVHRAIANLAKKGVLFVAASGNEGPAAGPSYPAAYDEVIAVTAVDRDLHVYRYANRGDYIDVAAPGVAIWTALPKSEHSYHSGTSFAVPFVTAALAVAYKQQPFKSKMEALRRLSFKDLGVPGRDPIYGNGLLTVHATCKHDEIAQTSYLVGGHSDEAAKSNESEILPWLH